MFVHDQLQLTSSIQKENGIQWIGSTQCTHTVVLFENLYFYYTLIVPRATQERKYYQSWVLGTFWKLILSKKNQCVLVSWMPYGRSSRYHGFEQKQGLLNSFNPHSTHYTKSSLSWIYKLSFLIRYISKSSVALYVRLI